MLMPSQETNPPFAALVDGLLCCKLVALLAYLNGADSCIKLQLQFYDMNLKM